MTHLDTTSCYETLKPGGLGAPRPAIWQTSSNLMIQSNRKSGTALHNLQFVFRILERWKSLLGKKIKKDKKIQSKIYLSFMAEFSYFVDQSSQSWIQHWNMFWIYRKKNLFMKKNVFRNFDFVVRQTDKMEAIRKITWSAPFLRFMLFIDSLLELLFERDIDFWKKIIISQKWRWWRHWSSFRNGKFEPPDPCAHFIFTFQTPTPLRFTTPSKKPDFRPLFADLGHFLTSDVILKENFCRLASIWLIDLMKLFALGRIDSAVGRKLWLAGKVAKFTEIVVILLRILSSVGEAWRPPGHPWRLRPVQVVSLLDTVDRYSKQSCVGGGCLWWSCVYNITEILNISSSIDSIYFLRFLLARFFCFRTAQTTANNQHVFRLDKLPDRPPRFHIPRHFLPKVYSISSGNFISVFWLKFKVSWPESFEGRVNEWDAVGTGWPSSILLGSSNDPTLRMFKLCPRQKSPRKKDKNDNTHLFFYIYFFVMLMSPIVWFERFIPFWTFYFHLFFLLKN